MSRLLATTVALSGSCDIGDTLRYIIKKSNAIRTRSLLFVCMCIYIMMHRVSKNGCIEKSVRTCQILADFVNSFSGADNTPFKQNSRTTSHHITILLYEM